MGHARQSILLAAAGAVLVSGTAFAGPPDDRMNDPRVKNYIVGDLKSGYVFSTESTRDMQDDDFTNPSFAWVDIGHEQWGKADGSAGKSCQDCHGDVEQSMKGVFARYPAYHAKTKKMAAIEHRINECRTERMGAKEWKWESDEMLGVSSLLGLQSRGMPISVKVDGPAQPFFEDGRDFYFKRRGQLDLACAMCHLENSGNMIRADLLSSGMANGFPTYRLKWQKLGSLHRRFKGCNDQVRAEPYKPGGPEYTNLELFVKWRSNGLPVETPSVRR